MRNFIDITNKKFNRLLPLEYLGNSMWKCICDCGTIKNVNSSNIRTGETMSCGCYNRELSSILGTMEIFGSDMEGCLS